MDKKPAHNKTTNNVANTQYLVLTGSDSYIIEPPFGSILLTLLFVSDDLNRCSSCSKSKHIFFRRVILGGIRPAA